MEKHGGYYCESRKVEFVADVLSVSVDSVNMDRMGNFGLENPSERRYRRICVREN